MARLGEFLYTYTVSLARPSIQFDNIQETLREYDSAPFSEGTLHLCALLALAVNDYTCNQNIHGMYKLDPKLYQGRLYL